MLRSIARILKISGYITSTYHSAESFLGEVEDLSPNCIISDLAMPNLSGLELQQALIERNAFFPLIFVTGQGDIRSSVEAMRLGAVDYLPKPVDQGELLEAVRRALERDRARVMSKMKVRSIAQLARIAERLDIRIPG